MLKRICLLALLLPATWAWATPQIQSWSTENGARVLFVPARELPIVDVSLVFDAAGSRDGQHPGLARLTNALLSEGAGGLSAEAISQRFAELGARFSSESLRDMATLELRSLSESDKLQSAAELLASIAARPDFPDSALERLRNQMLVGLRLIEQSPGKLAKRAFYRGLYGAHPYGSPPEGTEASVKAITARDVGAFHARYYVARNAVVAIVGDLDREAAEALAETVAGRLPAGQAPPPIPAPGPVSAHLQRIAHPSAQTHLLMGQTGMSRLDPDYFPLYVGNHALGGGGLVSLLAEQVREKRGLSYSVYSYFLPMRVPGPFIVGLQTRNDQAGQALEVARETLRRFVEEGPSAQELSAARQNLTGGFPLRIDSNDKILGYLAAIGFYGLPLDYLDRFVSRVEAVSREDVHDAFRRRIDPARLYVVLVGQSEQDQVAGTASAE